MIQHSDQSFFFPGLFLRRQVPHLDVEPTVFGDHLKEICANKPVTQADLLTTPSFNFTFNGHFINGISRPDNSALSTSPLN